MRLAHAQLCPDCISGPWCAKCNGGGVEVGVGEDDVGRLAAEFGDHRVRFSAAVRRTVRAVCSPPVKWILPIPG